MAYQNVATPRFYVNVVEWCIKSGIDIQDGHSAVINTLPVNPTSFGNLNFHGLQGMHTNAFVAVVGHKFYTDGVYYKIGTLDGNGENLSVYKPMTNIVNSDIANVTECYTNHDGFSISEFDVHNDIFFWKSSGSVVGSVIVGTFYEMKNAPNLSLSLNIEYGSTDETTSYNGSSFSNTFWSKQPSWGELGAWELGSDATYTPFSRSGRRVWTLTFSYMDDGDLWGSNQNIEQIIGDAVNSTLYDDDDLINNTTFKYNLLSDDNFFSQVWNKTLGGTIPFIFQPDKDNNNPDQFAICKIKENSLKATQSAFNVYDISLTIEEVW